MQRVGVVRVSFAAFLKRLVHCLAVSESPLRSSSAGITTRSNQSLLTPASRQCFASFAKSFTLACCAVNETVVKMPSERSHVMPRIAASKLPAPRNQRGERVQARGRRRADRPEQRCEDVILRTLLRGRRGGHHGNAGARHLARASCHRAHLRYRQVHGARVHFLDRHIRQHAPAVPHERHLRGRHGYVFDAAVRLSAIQLHGSDVRFRTGQPLGRDLDAIRVLGHRRNLARLPGVRPVDAHGPVLLLRRYTLTPHGRCRRAAFPARSASTTADRSQAETALRGRARTRRTRTSGSTVAGRQATSPPPKARSSISLLSFKFAIAPQLSPCYDAIMSNGIATQ